MGGGHIRSPSKKKEGAPILVPMLKSLHIVAQKGGVVVRTPFPLDPPMRLFSIKVQYDINLA